MLTSCLEKSRIIKYNTVVVNLTGVSVSSIFKNLDEKHLLYYCSADLKKFKNLRINRNEK